MSKSISAVLRLIFYARNEGSNNCNTTRIDRFFWKLKNRLLRKSITKEKNPLGCNHLHTSFKRKKIFLPQPKWPIIESSGESNNAQDDIRSDLMCMYTRYILIYTMILLVHVRSDFPHNFVKTIYRAVYLHGYALIFRANLWVFFKKNHVSIPSKPCIFIT